MAGILAVPEVWIQLGEWRCVIPSLPLRTEGTFQVSQILKKPVDAQSPEEALLLTQCAELVKELERRRKKQENFKRRQEEVCDELGELQRKVCELAEAIRQARHLVIYTGAGISTAASIPDYRGPNGVWTLLQKGQSVSASDLSAAEPTLTHMCIARLHDHNLVQHVVSQNCDGLHLRSGIPRSAVSELHGNMYIEALTYLYVPNTPPDYSEKVCTQCTPNREYVRLFDVTEHTALHRHQTGRTCHKCGGPLRDTIVHFGERGTLAQPLNWEAAAEAAKAAEVILCLGSSLKVLKKYPCLWCMNRPSCRRPKLYIVNLQWTPKDDLAALKINGKCDDVMKLLLGELGLDIPKYDRARDPIFSLAVPLRPEEEATRTRTLLSLPSSLLKCAAEIEATKEQLPPEPAPLTGGWFGRGCTKGIKRKKLV